MAEPPKNKQWLLPSPTGIDALQLTTTTTPPSPPGPNEVAMDLHAASLNYRDLVIIQAAFPTPIQPPIPPNLIPASDGAGIITSVGAAVHTFQPGDRVVTHMTPLLPASQSPDMGDICSGLGHGAQGTLRQSAVLPATAVVHAPGNLRYEEAATLTCSGLTAYNALFGVRGRQVRRDDWVLVQGSGGVSVAALQFAVAVGANVVATSASAAKAEKLTAWGAREVVNYRVTPAWGNVVKAMTPEGRGFDFVVDVGGDATLGQSLEAVRIEGVVVVAGMVGGPTEGSVPLMAVLGSVCTVRGVILGTKEMFEEMCRFVEEKGVRPVVDEKVFGFEEVKEALRYLERQEHFSKVVIKLR